LVKTGIAGNKDTTGLVIDYMIKNNWPLDYVITISEDHPDIAHISSYQSFHQWNIPSEVQVLHPEKYTLKAEQDIQMIEQLDIDILFVIGWQRLIPDWSLEHLTIGAFGMHGSSEPLPKGRGRSPLNWSIIQGKKEFLTNLVRYKPGIDDGDIIASTKFDITNRDTGGSLQMVNTLKMIQLLKENKQSLLNRIFEAQTQLDVKPTYYPKRRPVDGEILWNLIAEEIDRLVRATTKPFPGAYSYIEDIKIHIWIGIPLLDNSITDKSIKPGEVTAVLSDNTFTVKTGKGLFWVQNFSTPQHSHIHIHKGMNFSSKVDHCWNWQKLPMDSSKYCSDYSEIPESFKYYPEI